MRNREDKDEETTKYGKLKSVIVLSLGLAGVIIGSDLVVDSAVIEIDKSSGLTSDTGSDL